MQLIDILKLIEKKANYDLAHCFLNPVPETQAQRGECCKLYAVHAVMKWLHETDPSLPIPPPVRTNNALFAPKSLRHQAKRIFNSKVGEMYHSEELCQLAQLNDYKETVLFDLDEDNYVKTLIEQLKQGYAPIVFFDVDFDTKGPGFYGSDHEHAVVIVGYFHNKKGLPCFVATCWGDFFIYSADKLARSAGQLAQKRIPEVFHKIDGEWHSLLGRYWINPALSHPTRKGLAPEQIKATFRNKVLVVKAHENQNRTIFVKKIDDILLASIPPTTLRQALPDIGSNKGEEVSNQFIPLTEVIAFFTIDLVRPLSKRFNPGEFKQFFSVLDFKQQVYECNHQTFNAWINADVEGDIYSQNKIRARSIIEELSNSIDAHPEAIHLSVHDGYYTIFEQNGMGMSAQTICSQYLIPKESSKVNSDKHIGRFGIGSFTKLAHLNDNKAVIIVRTKTPNEIGLRLEFRLLNNQIHVAFSTDSTILQSGTLTQVFSSEINESEYLAMLYEHVVQDTKVPIFINNQKLIVEANAHQASLSINGICIQKTAENPDAYAMHVRWDFPADTTIAEGRDKIIVDNPKTLALIRQKIAEIRAMPAPAWVRYANTIAPLVRDLQSHNTSIAANDNLFDFLWSIVQEKLGSSACILDMPLYHPLIIANRLRLHSLLLPKDWISRIATRDLGWSNCTGGQLWITDMAFCDAGEYFLFDKEHHCVFVERSYYQRMVDEDKLPLLELILSHAPHEIDLRYEPPRLGREEVAVKSLNVVFNEVLKTDQLHNLYQQHGLLWLNKECTAKLLAANNSLPDILKHTKSLMVLYPEIINENMYSHPLAIFIYAGVRYYFDYYWKVLLDHHFQTLFHPKWDILKAKMRQLIGYSSCFTAVMPEQEIFLTAKDLLLVQNRDTQTIDLINGLGNRLNLDLVGRYSNLSPVIDEYYIYAHHNQDLLLHKGQIITTLCGWHHRLINNKWLATEKDYKILKLYDLETRSYLFSNALKFIVAEKYLLCEFPDNKWTLASLNGEIIFEFSLAKELHVVYFNCDVISTYLINLSLLDDWGHSSLLRATKLFSWEFVYFESTRSLGYPVYAIYEQEKDQLVIHHFANKNKLRFTAEQTKAVSNDQAANARQYWYKYEVKIPEKSLYQSQYILIKNHEKLSFLLPISLEEIVLQLDWKFEDIICIIRVSNALFFIRSSLKNTEISPTLGGNLLKALIDSSGKVLFIGTTLYLVNVLNDYYIFCDGYVYNSECKKIIDHKVSYLSILRYKQKEYLKVGEEKSPARIYDLQGNPVSSIEDKIEIENLKDGFYSYKTTAGKFLESPDAIIQDGELHGGNSGKDFNELITVERKKEQVYLVTHAGYPFFNAPIHRYYELLRGNIVQTKEVDALEAPATLSPLPLDLLHSPQVLQNISFLNAQSLDTYQYSSCLRFIEWPLSILNMMVPYIAFFTYTAAPERAEDYQKIIQFGDGLSSEAACLIFKVFNLVNLVLHEQKYEPFAQKLINIVDVYGCLVLAELYSTLQKYQKALRIHAPDFNKCKPIIDNFPNLSGQLCYYLLYPKHYLLSVNREPIFKHAKTMHSISLLQLMCTYQFDNELLAALDLGTEEFVSMIQNWGNYADKMHFIRVLQHAIYHQADPHHHLYEREFLQNALDAYVGDHTSKVIVDVHLYEEQKHCVFMIKDEGVGMSLKEIFKFYCLIGSSSKRHDRHQLFIGGHGVGAFTAFHNAEYIRLKTGQNKGYYYHVLLKPIYSVDDKVVDICVSWEEQIGNFQGTIVERVARGVNAALDAAMHQRTFKTHAATVDANVALIQFNGNIINQPLVPLATVDLPELGAMRLYQSVENMITVSGLAVRPIDDDLDYYIPTEIKKMVRKQGLIIDFPKKMPLNRERTEFIDAIAVYEFLKPYILSAYIEAYAQLFLQERTALTELPYDFFIYFRKYIDNMNSHNPDLHYDAECIVNKKPLKNYQKYQDPARLHELLAYLPLFKREVVESSCELHVERYSLIDLALYFSKHKCLPYNIIIPPVLEQFVKASKGELSTKIWQEECVRKLEKEVPEMDWVPRADSLTGDWLALIKLTEHIAQCMGYKITVGLSSIRNGSLVHTTPSSNTIYWNIFSVADPLENISQLFQALKGKKLTGGSGCLLKLYDNISHELVHALLENTHSNTHNNTFYAKQRKLLTMFSLKVNQTQLIKDIQHIFNENCIGFEIHFFNWQAITEPLMQRSAALAQLLRGIFNRQENTEQENVQQEIGPK